jgi:hypothetical protein
MALKKTMARGTFQNQTCLGHVAFKREPTVKATVWAMAKYNGLTSDLFHSRLGIFE